MKSLITLILAASFLTACATPEVWQRPGTSDQAAAADAATCHARAERDGYGASIYGGIGGYNYVHRCMASLGYRASLY